MPGRKHYARFRKEEITSFIKIESKHGLLRSAIIDHLTKLYNRRYFDQYLRKLIGLTKKKKEKFSLIMSDIDDFKMINDRYGHIEGDKVLIEFARLLRTSTRRSDVCFRYGGDEFVIISPDTDKETAESILERIRNKVDGHEFAIEGKGKLHFQLSFGSSVFPEDGSKPGALIKKADELLLQVKRQKKNTEKGITKSFILETKIKPPMLKENVIPRPRLISLLKENLVKKLILIAADAGYGKTTLLLQVMHTERLPCVFYNLDKGDGDLAVFFSYIVHSLEQIDPSLVERSKMLFAQGDEVGKNIELLMGTLINELVEKRKQELFFIMDDYHTISENSLALKALDYFIDHMPDIMHILIASREVPSLPSLAKWRSKQDLFELSRDDLKFTEEEVRELFTETCKIVLPEEELKRLSEKTEGWITGIQLILQYAGKDGKTIKETLNGYLKAEQPLFEYFANEIFAVESLAIQDFLKKSSILDIVNADACDRIFGMKNSEKLLKRLEKRNLFVSVVGKKQYKYHPLFQKFLQNQSNADEFKKDLHLKAADYYLQKEQMEQAIEHYLASGNYEKTGRLIVQTADRIEDDGRHAMLAGWLQQIPESVFEKQPRLLTIQGYQYHRQGHFEEAEKRYILAEQLLRDQGDTAGLAKTLLERGTLLCLKGHYAEAFEISRKALRACPDFHKEPVNPSVEETRTKIHNLIAIMWRHLGYLEKAEVNFSKAICAAKRAQFSQGLFRVQANLARLYDDLGKKRALDDLLKSLIEQVKDYTFGVGAVFATAAKIALDRGQTGWAQDILAQGWILCQPYKDVESQATLHRSFGLLYLCKAQWGEAGACLDKARQGYSALAWVQGEVISLIELSQLYRYQSNFKKAEECLELARQKAGDTRGKLEPMLLTELNLLQACQGKFDRAEQTVKKGLRLSRKFKWRTGEIYTRLAKTLVHLGRGQMEEALRVFGRAIHLARLNGYDGIVAREVLNNSHLAGLAQQFTSSPLKKYAVEKRHLLSLNLNTAETLQTSLRVQLFGRFELFINEICRSSELGRQTTKAILAYFLLHRKMKFSWETITSWAWPESSPATAHQMFKRALWEIRKCDPSMKSVILYRHKYYYFNLDFSGRIDVLEFENSIKQASVESETTTKIRLLEKTVDLYRGPFLQEMYYSWLDDLRVVFEEQYMKSLRSLAEMTAEISEFERSISYCLKFLALDNLDEKIHQLLITNYIRLERKSMALKQYELLRSVLWENLKSRPSGETAALIKSLH